VSRGDRAPEAAVDALSRWPCLADRGAARLCPYGESGGDRAQGAAVRQRRAVLLSGRGEVAEPKRKKKKKKKKQSYGVPHEDYKIGQSYGEFVRKRQLKHNHVAESAYRERMGLTGVESDKERRERVRQLEKQDKAARAASKSSSVHTVSGGLPTLGKDR
jgi:hypothetical protein